jgi:serine/threonine protein kinase
VYKLDEKLFIKIPRSPQCLSSLESEMAVLRLLHHECIPGCPNAKLGLVSYRRKCEVSEFSGLLLSGIVGVSASTYNAIFNRDQLTQIMTNVKSALVYAHESKYCHLDVCPSNIIVGVDVGTSSMRVQLGDWGSAKSVNAKMKGFWGSVGFAHDAIHKEGEHGKWEPKPEYDFGSLAYTMAALMGGFHHEVPWPHFFDNIEVNERMLKSRRDMSLDIIQKSSLDSELRAVLCGYVPEPPPLVATGASLPEAKASTQYPSTGPTKKRKLPEAQLSTPSMHAAATTQKLAPVDTTALSPSTRRS